MPRGMIDILCTGSAPRQRGGDQRVSHLVIGDDLGALRGFSSRDRFSMPATRRSTARVKSSIVTRSPPRRVAVSAASFTRLARSAPEKPGVIAAI